MISAVKGAVGTKTVEPDAEKAAEAAKNRARLLRLGQAFKRLTEALIGSVGGSVRMADLPELRDLAELRELVALRDQRAAHTDHGIGPNPGSAEEAKATGLRALPYRAALAALDLILSAASRGQATLPGVRIVDHPSGFAVTGVMRRTIHETLTGVETVTAISSTLQPETLAPWFSRVDVEGAWEPLEDDPVERTQVLAGTATSSVVDQGGALTNLGAQIAEQIDALRLVEERPILIASVKKVIAALMARLKALEVDGRPRAPITGESYAALLGSNDYIGYGTFIAVGRTLPTYHELRLTLEALVGGPVEPPPPNPKTGQTGYWEHEEIETMTKTGETYKVRRPTHPDPVVAAFLRDMAISPIIQSDRSRAQRRGTPARRIVFGDLALPERFDRVVRRVKQALGDDLGRVAARWGLVPEEKANGLWPLLALLQGEDDPLGAGAARVRERVRRGDDIVDRITEEAPGKQRRARLWAVIERRGKRSIRLPVFVDVEARTRRFPTVAEALARGDEIAAGVAELGWLPAGVTLSFEARRGPRARTKQVNRGAVDG